MMVLERSKRNLVNKLIKMVKLKGQSDIQSSITFCSGDSFPLVHPKSTNHPLSFLFSPN
jgi:hypothetical protein